MGDLFDLPETQTQECVEGLTQSQETLIPWGHLYAVSPHLSSVDLTSDCYIFGRNEETCDVVIKNSQLPFILNISKEHFKLTVEDNVVYLTDLSKNGTFINSRKLGRNNRNIIHSDDVIALGHQKSKAYIFNNNLTENMLNLPRELKERYYVMKILGQGATGEVRLALNKQTFKEFAIKKIIKCKSSYGSSHLTHPKKIKTEIEILRKLDHPFIIQMEEVIETDEEVFLVLEYMKGGVLNSRIRSIIPLPEDEVKFIFYQILLAVQYLHKNGITHRDLKPENVLLSSDGIYPSVKISDFGLSKIMEEFSSMDTICGTINYAAPEILRMTKEKYTEKVDVWSLGVMLFYMLFKILPFCDTEKRNVVEKIRKGFIQWNDGRLRGYSLAKDLIKKMLEVNPERRISVDSIFAHPWIENDGQIKNRVKLIYPDIDDIFETSSDEDIFLTPPVKRPRM